nr:hypothetical protein BaRGS_000720 [Batillaria attramentaria]
MCLPPPLGLDLRIPWKAPVLGAPEKVSCDLLSSLHSLPYPFTFFQHLRRQHYLMTSDRLAASVTVPKTSPPPLPVIGQPCTVTSPLPALPAPVGLQNFFPLSTPTASPRGVVEERLGGSAHAAPAPLVCVDSPPGSATSPYGRKLFPCPQCRYTTDRRNNLKRHMLTMHQVSAKMLECCGVLFRTKAALREHALIFHYHGYTCFYCGRRFCRKALLKRHLSVHNGQKEFICSVCDYATSHKSNLERHRRVHARQDGDKENDDDVRQLHDDIGPLSDDVRSNTSESNSHVDVSCDELSVCSDDEDEEINVHSD